MTQYQDFPGTAPSASWTIPQPASHGGPIAVVVDDTFDDLQRPKCIFTILCIDPTTTFASVITPSWTRTRLDTAFAVQLVE